MVLDPIRALVTCATGQDVDFVFVDGRAVVSGGRVLAADEGRLQAAAPGIMDKLQAAAAAQSARLYCSGTSGHGLAVADAERGVGAI